MSGRTRCVSTLLWITLIMIPFWKASAEIKSDEEVVFFPTPAHLSADGESWRLLIHGWIFEPEENDLLRRALLAQIADALNLQPGQPVTRTLKSRLRLFLRDNERGKTVRIRIGRTEYSLAESDADGHFLDEVLVPRAAAEKLARNGWLPFEAVMAPGDERSFTGRCRLTRPSGVTVISDIDDTIKVTQVTNRVLLVQNTFLRPFRVVEGMPKLYRRLAEAGVEFDYVSLSPWQLYEPLAELLEQQRFPAGTFHLRRFRIKDSTFLELFADPVQAKLAVLRETLRAMPGREVILIGDSGEKDPEVYGRMAREFPRQVRLILIRDVTNAATDAARFESAFRGVSPMRWQVFEKPADVRIDLPPAAKPLQ